MNRTASIILLLVGTIVVIAVLYLIVPTDLFDPRPRSSHATDEVTSPPESPASQLDGLDMSRRALVDFFDADSWQERMPTIYRSDVLNKTITNYYRERDDHDFASAYDMELFHMEESAGPGTPYYIYFVSTPQVPVGVPVTIRQWEDRYFVDWSSFVEFYDHHFVDFAADTESAPADFRAVVKRAEYWGPDRNSFTDLDDYLCYEVELPYTEETFFAFVRKSDPTATQLKKAVNWGSPPLAGILRFEHRQFPHGNTHLVITGFLTEDWYRDPSQEPAKVSATAK